MFLRDVRREALASSLAKPATIAEYLQGVELQEHRQTVCKRGKRTTTIYRWLNAVPLRATDDAILVNWFSIEILQCQGQANLLQQLRHRSRDHPRHRRRTGRLRPRTVEDRECAADAHGKEFDMN